MKSVPLPPGRAGLRWGIYARISSRQGTKVGEDETDRVSLDSQDTEARALIKTLDPDGTIDDRYVVREIHTGTELFPRRKLKHIRDGLKAGHIDAVACYHPFRWTRDPEHAGYLATERREQGYLLRFALDDPGDDDASALVSYITHWSGRQQHRQIVEQTSSNRRALVRKGRAWVGPKAPYGLRWRYETRIRPDGSQVQYKVGWLIQDREAPVLRRIFEELLLGRSVRLIAEGLMADEIPAPKGGTCWYPSTIGRLIRDTTYRGEAYALRRVTDKADTYVSQKGETEGRTRSRVKERDREEWVKLPEGYAPPIVEPETFDAAQVVLADRKPGGRAPLDPTATLMGGGRARCGVCGRSMQRRGKGRRLLYCHGVNVWNPCPSKPSIPMATLDAAAKRLAHRIYGNPAVLAERIAAHRASDPLVGEIALIERTIADLEQRRASLEMVMESITHPSAARDLAQRLDLLAQQRERAEADRAELDARRVGWQRDLAFLDRFTLVAGQVKPKLDGFGHAEWQEAIDALQIQAHVYAEGSPERYVLTNRLDEVTSVSVEACLVERSSPSTLHQTRTLPGGAGPLVLSWPASVLGAIDAPA